ncbi:hypothetical protein QR685DRAFT_246664 [Neurospora intermedia]|uniref:C3H1-type domain-containing protein n=1 Tax=Neurospora intermedia TaxID=5142 RepID=A0ABR3DBZ2_NEUIN
MATSESDLMAFYERFQTLSFFNDSSARLIEDLLRYSKNVEDALREENRALRRQLTDAQLDLEDATRSRRDLQQQVANTESRNRDLAQDNHHLKNNNPFVVVLIDGDCCLFKEALIRQGVEGGKKAAYALRSAILEQCGDFAGNMEVIAKVYANLGGLAKAMRRNGCLEAEETLKEFTIGFTQGKATFDFVDVGHGKERADNKIKETAKWNLRNYNCKQLLLGISHDAGYAPFLDELFQDETKKRRVTVVEGIPTVRELVSTGVNILNFNDEIFRSEKLVDKTALRTNTSPLITTSSSSTTTPTVSNGNLPTPTSSTTSTPANATASYAGAIGNASPPPKITLPIQPRPVNANARASATPKQPAWNPGPRGLDPPIKVSPAALESIKKRKDNNKLCNNHYLRGPCSKGDACCFEHKYKPSKEEINAIAFLARLNPCTSGQDCDVEDCIYGHHCPNVKDGVCTHPYCKFEDADHPPGTKYRSTKTYDYFS